MNSRQSEVEQLVREIMEGTHGLTEARVRSIVDSLVSARSIEADFVIEAGVPRRIADAAWRVNTWDTAEKARRFLAVLVQSFAPGLQPVAGFRGFSAGTRLSFTFEQGEVTIEIALKRRSIEGVTPDLYTLMGHLKASVRATQALAVCTGSDGASRYSDVDEDGFFSLEAEGTSVKMEIHTEVGVIELPSIGLAAGAAE